MIAKGTDLTYSWQEVKKLYSDAELVFDYFGITKVPCVISSPLRKDNKPSFAFYSYNGKDIFWIDFSTKEKGSLQKLFCLFWNCSLKECVIKIINKNKLGCRAVVKKDNKKKKATILKSTSDLKCKVRAWNNDDIMYWKSYGISLKWLKYADVYPVSHLLITKEGKQYTFKADKYAYAFVEKKEGKTTLKIYQPFNTKGYKWSNKHDRSVISLWTKLPKKGNILTICSSLKDALCFWENTGIPAVALQGEGYSMSNTAVKILKERFKTIYIIFDNDDAGIKDGKKLSEETGFKNIILPKFEGGKDISDYFKLFGKKQFTIFINSLFETKHKSYD